MLALSLFFVLAVVALLMMIVISSVRIALFKYRAPAPLPAKQYNDTKLLAAIASLEAAVKGLPQAIAKEVAKVAVPVAQVTPNNVVQLSSGQEWTPKTVVIEGRSYDSPKLFSVIEWLKNNPDKREWPIRQIADETNVSKSWVAIAKKYKTDAEASEMDKSE